MNKRYNVLGINDDRDYCECCGKNNLKKVVWIEDTETGEVKHFGVVCALKPVKGFERDAEIKRASRMWEQREKDLLHAAYLRYRKYYKGTYVAIDPTDPYKGSKPTDPALWKQCEAEVRHMWKNSR